MTSISRKLRVLVAALVIPVVAWLPVMQAHALLPAGALALTIDVGLQRVIAQALIRAGASAGAAAANDAAYVTAAIASSTAASAPPAGLAIGSGTAWAAAALTALGITFFEGDTMRLSVSDTGASATLGTGAPRALWQPPPGSIETPVQSTKEGGWPIYQRGPFSYKSVPNGNGGLVSLCQNLQSFCGALPDFPLDLSHRYYIQYMDYGVGCTEIKVCISGVMQTFFHKITVPAGTNPTYESQFVRNLVVDLLSYTPPQTNGGLSGPAYAYVRIRGDSCLQANLVQCNSFDQTLPFTISPNRLTSLTSPQPLIQLTQAMPWLSEEPMTLETLQKIADKGWKYASARQGYTGKPYVPVTTADTLGTNEFVPMAELVKPAGTSSGTSTGTGTGTGTGTATTVNVPDYCATNPTRAGCAELGTPTPSGPVANTPFDLTVVPTAFQSSTSCPSGPAFSAFGHQYSLSYEPICTGMAAVRPVIVFMGAAMAAWVLADSFRMT